MDVAPLFLAYLATLLHVLRLDAVAADDVRKERARTSGETTQQEEEGGELGLEEAATGGSKAERLRGKRRMTASQKWGEAAARNGRNPNPNPNPKPSPSPATLTRNPNPQP